MLSFNEEHAGRRVEGEEADINIFLNLSTFVTRTFGEESAAASLIAMLFFCGALTPMRSTAASFYWDCPIFLINSKKEKEKKSGIECLSVRASHLLALLLLLGGTSS